MPPPLPMSPQPHGQEAVPGVGVVERSLSPLQARPLSTPTFWTPSLGHHLWESETPDPRTSKT